MIHCRLLKVGNQRQFHSVILVGVQTAHLEDRPHPLSVQLEAPAGITTSANTYVAEGNTAEIGSDR